MIRTPAMRDPSALMETEVHALNFRQARHSRRAELVEDYVELIADLMDSGGEARPVDVARRLGVTQATVSKMLKRLVGDELVIQQPYRGVFLTEKGRKLAELSRVRHRIVESFLLSLGISADNARIDAEGIEHHVSEETLETFRRLTEQSNPKTSAARKR
jgi:DtxR family manganese transport transcriptional regulator